MYAASRSPRSARTSSRIASSSRAMSSRSSGVRCSRSVVLMRESPGELEVDLDRARRSADAGADHLAVGALDVAGAQVAHGAGVQAPDAGIADAHAAAVRQQRAGLLAGDQQRCRAVRVDVLAAGQEADATAVARHALRSGDGAEALEMQALRDLRAREARGERVQQARGAARPGLPLAPIRHVPVKLANRPAAGAIVVVLVQEVAAMAGCERSQLHAEDRLL